MAGIAAAAAIAVLGAAPSGASAAEGCLFESGGTQDVAKLERSLFCLTNVHRARSGLQLLRIDTRLAKAARGHSLDMAARGYFDHFDPEGRGPSERAAAAGYPGQAAENIAEGGGSFTPRTLFELWRDSPSHNENMLTPSYVAGGFGIALQSVGGGSGFTGTQNFGLVRANTGDTGMSFYASSTKCAKAKRALLKLKANKKLKKQRKKAAIARAKRKIAALCASL